MHMSNIISILDQRAAIASGGLEPIIDQRYEEIAFSYGGKLCFYSETSKGQAFHSKKNYVVIFIFSVKQCFFILKQA